MKEGLYNMEIIDHKHPEWEEMLTNSVAEHKSTIHHFEREDNKIKTVLWAEIVDEDKRSPK
jgi:hypothetical protein